MKMRYKHLSISSIVLAVCIQLILCVRIPPNPCPDVFQYYQDRQGRIYGEATVPYDNSLRLVFSVNASFVGKFNTKTELKIKMVTKLHEFQNTRNVIYDIFFPFTNVIPKITSVQYNGQIFCSGPGEPVIPGEPGITNVWSEHTFVMSGRPQGYYPPPSSVEEPDLSDSDIPVKNPGETLTHKTTTTTTTTTTTSRPWTPPRQPTRPKPTQPPTQPPTQWTPPMQWITPATDKQTEPQPVWTSPSETADIDGLIQTLFTRPNQVTTPEPPATFTSPSVTTNEEFKCGVPNNDVPNNYIVPLILGATETTPGQYPWLVALFMKNGKKYDYKCTANLVSDNHILTAARCIQYLNIQIVKTEDIFLIMGTNSLENWNSKGVITRKARKVDVHPAFKQNSKSAHGDIAVILMNRPVQFSNVLRPVCLWKSSTDLYPLINQMGVVAGFGQDEDSQSNGLKHVLRAKRADMPIVSQTECWTSPLGFKDVTSDKTFCTKSHDGLTGPCIGDSGAGFFVEINGVYYLRGITSIVYTENGRCDLSTKYSVFCDVAKFQDWIKSNMI